MAFWTSNEPGVLPKWIFWFYSTMSVLSLLSLGIVPSSQISTVTIVGFLASTLFAGLARINAVKILVGIAAVVCLIFVCSSLFLIPVFRESEAGGVISAIMVGYAAQSVWWVWYLNLYRAKPSPTDNIARPPTDSYPVAKSYSPPQPRGAGSAPSEKQLGERGIFDIEHGGTAEKASPDDYAIELSLFETGDLDESLWVKHLVEAEGDSDKAKWRYIKARVKTAPARRAEREEAERKAAEEAERKRLEQQEAARKAALREIGEARLRKHEERERAGLVVKPNETGFVWVLLALTATFLLTLFFLS